MSDKPDDQEIVHCFYVWLAQSDGSTSIFRKLVNPTEVVKIEPLPQGGSRLTERIHGQPEEFDVTTPKPVIEAQIRRCQELDAAARRKA